MINAATLLQCEKDHSFLLISSDENIVINIYDVIVMWEYNDNLCFHTGYRLAGKKETILQQIKIIKFGVKITNDLLKQIEKTIVSKSDHKKAKALIFKQEIKNRDSHLRDMCLKIRNPESMDQHDPLNAIDPFDRKKYHEEYILFEKYFEKMELYIRVYSWIIYKYVRLGTQSDILELQNDLLYDHGKPRKNTKEWLEIMTDMFEPEHFIYLWYKHFKPSALWNAGKLAEKYKNHYNEFFNMIYKRYIDSNHIHVDLPFF